MDIKVGNWEDVLQVLFSSADEVSAAFKKELQDA